MQKAYVHSVAADDQRIGDPEGHRIALVFRFGDEVVQVKDSGSACEDLSPRPDNSYVFGRNLPGLKEGRVYSRQKLWEMGYHRYIGSII